MPSEKKKKVFLNGQGRGSCFEGRKLPYIFLDKKKRDVCVVVRKGRDVQWVERLSFYYRRGKLVFLWGEEGKFS